MKVKGAGRWAVVGLGLVLVACATPDMPEPEDGALLFSENCASCHGADGGGGMDVDGLRPPSLTALESGNGGVFPRAKVLSRIDGYGKGRNVGPAMPEFGAFLTGDSVPVEIDGVMTPTPRPLAALLAYLESIQDS